MMPTNLFLFTSMTIIVFYEPATERRYIIPNLSDLKDVFQKSTTKRKALDT